ncbi:Dol-P-Man:Man(5)GlcNAc(2)-PP-Dol alpha-1,3-mannosyltransferase [Trichinella pseudospiralis]|uniref:dolichyl-P-Man:Man5GlcNAc2-PP-dolichol alpha-1,3-mannosyltransferase n=2 Tax=Trichinella pseudospiralis TaxID=6337 RepID=A0A0V1ILL3_TRIPS|nr:Dol-P-Man:Man(5)GlcNAc(2)-PP-Dol alpha-1,3-mannosyltransferase [Trichinella pseudospiralis]KRZ30037.1 Dol-P-Man:Man(5)GlcNAc(2)-PP-Dol alpha-1,3-mannosyltransferase [Trichinella pseudospiralis]
MVRQVRKNFRGNAKASTKHVECGGPVELIKSILLDIKHRQKIAVALFLFEFVLCLWVVATVPYTEIDWIAYMQQVEGFINGTFDYTLLKGDTGPLVYPAGHVYIYTVLYYLTNHGRNIFVAQLLFTILYLCNLIIVFFINIRSGQVPSIFLIFMSCTSYRIHSIFLLRLFNDPIAMFLFYIALLCWIYRQWTAGIVLYSLALSVKMNILLFSPAVAVICLYKRGLQDSCRLFALAFLIQVTLAIPFLHTNPLGYLQNAFNFGRVFDHRWTVNWRFVPEEVFTHKCFHCILLLFHIILVFYFLYIKFFRSRFASIRNAVMVAVDSGTVHLKNQEIVLLLAGVNLIGISFSRSLHYQFYVWYYHLLPFLSWQTPYSTTSKLTLLGIIEMCWNVYPSTLWSSLLLHLCHAILLVGLFLQPDLNSKRKSA